MKKIGIISLFGYNNYGNRLQLYAVQQVYKNLGYDSEIIKYIHPTTKDPLIIRVKVFVHYVLNLRKNLAVATLKNLRIRNFKKHALKFYKESKNFADPLKIDAKFHENYSFFSVGSDQVWGWFTADIAEFVFLKFAPRAKRLAFAPSFGSAKIDQKYRKVFSEGLNGFNTISVREKSGAQLVEKFTGKEAVVLCDPTMCLSREEWLAFSATHHEKPKEKYILTYFLGEKNVEVNNILFKYSKDYKVVELNNLEVSKYYAINPSEWVDYINDATLFLTDSFHGVVFSILMHTPFAVYKRVGGENMQTRITHILEKFSLQDRFEISAENEGLFSMNFHGISEIVETEKQNALDFLRESLIFDTTKYNDFKI